MKIIFISIAFTLGLIAPVVFASCAYNIEDGIVEFQVEKQDPAGAILKITHPAEVRGWPLDSVLLMYRKDDSAIDALLESKQQDAGLESVAGFMLKDLQYILARVTYKNPENECVRVATFSGSESNT